MDALDENAKSLLVNVFDSDLICFFAPHVFYHLINSSICPFQTVVELRRDTAFLAPVCGRMGWRALVVSSIFLTVALHGTGPNTLKAARSRQLLCCACLRVAGGPVDLELWVRRTWRNHPRQLSYSFIL